MTRRLIVKSNRLIEASYTLTLSEQRLILLAIFLARETGQGLNADCVLEIYAAEYIERFRIERHTGYQMLKDACNKLFERELVYIDTDPETKKERFNRQRWVDKVSYIDDVGKVQIRFSGSVIPLITRLSENYTSYELEQVAQLTSVYAIRLYETLIKWKGTLKTPDISLKDFRLQVGLEDNEYKRMTDFKKRVLDAAVEQINEHTDIWVSYDQVKVGRLISGFKFKFNYKAQAIEGDDAAKLVAPTPLKLTEKQIKLFASKLSKDGIFGSTHAEQSESFADLEARLVRELAIPENVEKYSEDLKRIGFNLNEKATPDKV